MSRYYYYKIYKPYGMLSQFSKENPSDLTLTDLGKWPKDVYPVGRLDKESEGLLILTNDNSFKTAIFNKKTKRTKEYYVQLEGNISEQAIGLLKNGLELNIRGIIIITEPCKVFKLAEEPKLSPRIPPIRTRKSIPTCWISIELLEGKYHQVRKMCAKVGYPVLRLVRVRLGEILLSNMQSGEIMEIEAADLYKA